MSSYLYTSGSFVNDGIDNYHTICLVGQRTANAEPIYFGLLHAALLKGMGQLMALEEGATQERLFWREDQ